jgi:hypothetical protein
VHPPATICVTDVVHPPATICGHTNQMQHFKVLNSNKERERKSSILKKKMQQKKT